MKGGTGYWDTDRDDKEAFVWSSWKAGHSAREIVAALVERFGPGVTRNAVISKVHRMGLAEHRPGPKLGSRNHA